MKIIRVNHTGVTVSNLDRTSAFFRDVLGFEVTEPRLYSGDYISRMLGVEGASIKLAFCKGGGHTIELIQYVNPPPRSLVPRAHNEIGFMHIAILVEDIDLAARALVNAGFELVSDPQTVEVGPSRGGKNVYARDPAGLILELQQAPGASLS